MPVDVDIYVEPRNSLCVVLRFTFNSLQLAPSVGTKIVDGDGTV